MCKPADDWWGLACTLLAYGRARKSLDLSRLTHHERVGRVLAWSEYAAGAYDVFRQVLSEGQTGGGPLMARVSNIK
jgi:hypothetical protein